MAYFPSIVTLQHKRLHLFVIYRVTNSVGQMLDLKMVHWFPSQLLQLTKIALCLVPWAHQ